MSQPRYSVRVQRAARDCDGPMDLGQVESEMLHDELARTLGLAMLRHGGGGHKLSGDDEREITFVFGHKTDDGFSMTEIGFFEIVDSDEDEAT